MITRILRERKQRAWKSAAKHRKLKQQQECLEKKLHKLKERRKPALTHNVNGILVGIHCLRTRYGKQFRFEFNRNDDRGPASDFGKGDLKALISAVQEAIKYCDSNAT